MNIAVLMTTYNGEKFLEEQICSILNQKTEYEIQLIVRDDGSSDNTINILEKYRNQGKLIYSKGENIGAAKGFIQLLRNNQGFDYYAFADQDDVWMENKIQKGISSIADRDKPALYCSNCELVDEKMNSLGRNTHRKTPTYSLASILCLACCAQGCTAVFNRQLAKIIQDNDIPNEFIMHDSLLTCLCGLIDGDIIYDEVPSMKYRMHSSNVLGLKTAKQNLLGVLRDRYEEIVTRNPIGMYEQARSIIDTYGAFISEENKKMCELVISAQHSNLARIKLAMIKSLKHDTLNKTITKKLQILLGNG